MDRHPDVGEGPTAVVPAGPPTMTTTTTGGLAAADDASPPTPQVPPSVAAVAPPTPALPVSSAAMSRWKRSNMRFRREAIARFEPTATATKPKNRKPCGGGGGGYVRPKVTIRFARTALEEAAIGESVAAAAAAAAEPQQVAAIKLKFLGLETKSQMPKYRVE